MMALADRLKRMALDWRRSRRTVPVLIEEDAAALMQKFGADAYRAAWNRASCLGRDDFFAIGPIADPVDKVWSQWMPKAHRRFKLDLVNHRGLSVDCVRSFNLTI
jgi:hypothetical protein